MNLEPQPPINDRSTNVVSLDTYRLKRLDRLGVLTSCSPRHPGHERLTSDAMVAGVSAGLTGTDVAALTPCPHVDEPGRYIASPPCCASLRGRLRLLVGRWDASRHAPVTTDRQEPSTPWVPDGDEPPF